MSGIAGIFYRNNRPVQLEQLQAMGAALAHRGPDGINYYCKGSVGFLHCMLHDTPESLFETLPNKTEDENFVITFHGRIDNRQELYDKIGWVKPLSAITDSDLVLGAYRKWRKECVDYLLGDFAFAIWDQVERKLFCARDHMGVKPFYYYKDDNRIIFASQIRGVFALKEILRTINFERVADFLSCGVTDYESSFYEGILRLPPAHFLDVSSTRMIVSRYFEMTPMKSLEGKNSEVLQEQFNEIFTKAVSCRLRSAYRVGSYLSGGLDSSSIVCMAAGKLQKSFPDVLHTFSGVFNTVTICDERDYFYEILKRYEVQSHVLVADELNPDLDFDAALRIEDEPFFAPHSFMMHNLLPMVKHSGVRVMLDGHDGDSAVSYGLGLFPELLLKGHLKKLLSEFRAIGNPNNRELAKRVFRTLRDILRAHQSFPQFHRELENYIGKTAKMLKPDFFLHSKVEVRLRKHFKSKARPGQNEQTQHLKNICKPLHTQMLEFMERQSVHQQIILRFPYFDIRLIQFCLGLPAQEKFHDGYNRLIVRNSLIKILPDKIRLRKSKTNFFPNISYSIRSLEKQWLSFIVDTIGNSSYNFLIEQCYVKDLYSIRGVNSKSIENVNKIDDLIKIFVFCKWLVLNANGVGFTRRCNEK